MKNNNQGFTLIELLIIIAIIGILASVVLTSLNGAREKASRAAAVATLKGVMPVLSMCNNDGAYGYTDGAPTGDTTYICQDEETGNSPMLGHEDSFWPALNGWDYETPIGELINESYVFTATKAEQDPITCTFATGVCE